MSSPHGRNNRPSKLGRVVLAVPVHRPAQRLPRAGKARKSVSKALKAVKHLPRRERRDPLPATAAARTRRGEGNEVSQGAERQGDAFVRVEEQRGSAAARLKRRARGARRVWVQSRARASRCDSQRVAELVCEGGVEKQHELLRRVCVADGRRPAGKRCLDRDEDVWLSRGCV